MLSCCIVNWNTRDFLRECLASLLACPPSSSAMEVIVVDNDSRDRSVEMVREEFPEVRLIANGQNRGYADANNQALSQSRGDALLLLNPDTRMLSGSLDAAMRALGSSPDIGAVGARQIGPDGRTQSSLRSFPEPMPILYEWLGLARVFPRSRRLGKYRMRWFGYGEEIDVDQPMGTFLMISRQAYENVGEMNPVFPIFFNEVDWCYRAKQAGWRIVYCPDARVVHYGGSGTGKAPRAAMIRESHQSLLRFYDLHYHKEMAAAAYALARSAILLSSAIRSLAARR